MAREDILPGSCSADALSCDIDSWTLTYLDLVASLPDDLVWNPDIELTDYEISSLRRKDRQPKPKIMPYVSIDDLNRAHED